MYIRNTKSQSVPVDSFVSDEEIISTIFEIAPTVVFDALTKYDFGNYLATIPEHCNHIIIDYLIDSQYGHIISNNFIEVIKDASFDYEYGGIYGTQHETVLVGYVPRTPEFQAIACEVWDDDYYWR